MPEGGTVWLVWESPPRGLEPALAAAGWRVAGRSEWLEAWVEQAAHVAADWVIVNAHTPSGGLPLGEALRQFRLRRPAVRCLLCLGPPTPETAALKQRAASLGVTDWVDDPPDLYGALIAALAQPRTLADVLPELAGDPAPPPADPAPPPSAAPRPDPAPDPPATPRFSGLPRRLLWQRRAATAPAAGPDPGESPRVVQARRLVVLGATGGAGVSSLVAALAGQWHRWGLAVAVVDAASTGGWLPVAFGGEPVPVGWDLAVDPARAWHVVRPGLWLLPQSGGPRPPLRADQHAERLKAALAAGPVTPWPALLVDGGSDPGWLGALAGLVEASVLVVPAHPAGWYAGARLAAIARAVALPCAGVVVTRRRLPGQPLGVDAAAAWGLGSLADFPEEPALWDALWQDPRRAEGLAARIEPLAGALVRPAGARRARAER